MVSYYGTGGLGFLGCLDWICYCAEGLIILLYDMGPWSVFVFCRTGICLRVRAMDFSVLVLGTNTRVNRRFNQINKIKSMVYLGYRYKCFRCEGEERCKL